ncbi:sulfurtransferase [Leptospira sp. 'Mane']|uniref:sulfurtransferase n=1 Tax=Leptospira sp. 'Mane' TaxID=3387407 RepID=UPI00398AAE26
MRSTKILILLLSLFLITSNCKKPPEYAFVYAALKLAVPIYPKVNSAEELASESADNYSDNKYGLITASTLEKYRSDWANSKPEGITGQLIVFQVQTDPSAASGRYVLPNGKDVFTHLLLYGNNYFGQTRSNGIIDTENVVPAGKTIDGFIGAYSIDLRQDLVVFAADTPTDNNLLLALRGWFALRYWGVDKKHLAVLNGAVKNHATSGALGTFTTISAAPPSRAASVKTIFTDNTILQATVGDIIHILKNAQTTFTNVTPVPAGGIFFWDSRTNSEYTGTTGSTLASSSMNCVNKLTTPITSNICYVNHEGNISGAKNIPTSSIINSSTSEFKTKAEIKTILANAGYTQGKTVITYDQTNVKTAAAFFASNSIAGYPTRNYEGSWVEWGSLGNRKPSQDVADINPVTGSAYPAPNSLDSASPWRTDYSFLTGSLQVNTAYSVPNYNLTTTKQYSTSSYTVIETDKKYLLPGSSSSSGGGAASSGGASGGGGNACGG